MDILDNDGSARARKAGIKDWKKLREAVKKIWDSAEYKTRRAKMDRHLRQFKGHIWKEGAPDAPRSHESKAIANYLFSTIASSAPMMSDNRPSWTIVAKVPWLQNLANAYKMAGDYAWDVLDMAMTSYYGSIDAFLFGVGIDKLYWDYEEDELAIENVDPRTFIIAPGYTKIWKAPWCGTYEKLPLSWVRQRFPGVKGIKPAEGEEEFDYDGSESWQLDNYFTNVYSLWMKDDDTTEEMVEEILGEDGKTKKGKKTKKRYPNGKFVFFTDTTFLACEASDFEHGKAPYVEQKDYDVPHEFWAMGEGDQIEGLNLELNLMLRKIFHHIRNYAEPNQWVDAGIFGTDPDAVKENYKDGGQVYFINPGNKEPEKWMGFCPQPPVMQDVWQIISLIIKLIEEITGVTDISKGIPGKKERQSASEISVLIESSYTRIRQKTRNQESALKRKFWMIVSLMQQYYSGQRPIHNKLENGEQAHMNIGNSVAYARQQIAPQNVVEKGQTGQQLTPDQQALYENYKQFAAAIEGSEDVDPVYFSFDIEVETNSQLPLDKQSLANLMLRLFQMQGIDRQAVLEVLQIPRGQEITERMDAKEQQGMMKPGGGPMPPQAGQRPQPGPNMSIIQGGQNE